MKDDRSILARYADNPIIRALVNFIPAGIGSAVDILIMDRVQKIKESRVRTFFDELASGGIVFSDELVQSDDFLHALDSTMRAAFRSRHEEKIRIFARLLNNGVIEGRAVSADDYEELVSLLDELSLREWHALLMFRQRLDAVDPTGRNGLQRVIVMWPDFVVALEQELQVPLSEASSFMNRIARTGLYNEFTGSFMDYSGGLGTTTPKFDRFRALVKNSE